MQWVQSQDLRHDGEGAVKGAGKGLSPDHPHPAADGKAGKDAGKYAASGCPAGKGKDADNDAGQDADEDAGKGGTAGKYAGKGLSPGRPRLPAETKAGNNAGKDAGKGLSPGRSRPPAGTKAGKDVGKDAGKGLFPPPAGTMGRSMQSKGEKARQWRANLTPEELMEHNEEQRQAEARE